MLSVVILTFNNLSAADACLDSLFSQIKSAQIEVILVDNGSDDGTVDFVKRQYPRVKVIENKNNLGASRARNQGIDASSGEWILTLDCDVRLCDGFIDSALGFIKEMKYPVGMVQPKILNPDEKTLFSCGIYLSKFRRFFNIASNKKDDVRYGRITNIFGLCSCAGFYRRKMLLEIKDENGYFDERFFFMVEDVDLSWRAQIAGWKAVFYPAAKCCHSGGSSGFDKLFRQYLCWRNRYYMIAKNEGARHYGKKFFPGLLYDLPRMGYLFLTNHYVRKAFLDKRQCIKNN